MSESEREVDFAEYWFGGGEQVNSARGARMNTLYAYLVIAPGANT